MQVCTSTGVVKVNFRSKDWSVHDQQHLNVTGKPPEERRTLLTTSPQMTERGHGLQCFVKSTTSNNIPSHKQVLGNVRSVKANVQTSSGHGLTRNAFFWLERDSERQFDGDNRPCDVDPSCSVFACMVACRHT